jgi:acyl carrier protein
MLRSEAIRERVRSFVVQNFVFVDDRQVANDQSLLKSGIIDSTGIIEVISFAEDEFDVRFDDADLVAENFDTIDRVTACVMRKLQVRAIVDLGDSAGSSYIEQPSV